jgi:hypothetical protein
MLQLAHRGSHINMNCVDPLGRGALSLAIDGENLEMVELLVIMGVETKDALLHSIDVGFVEAAELLLEHEELIHKEKQPYVSPSCDSCITAELSLFKIIKYIVTCTLCANKVNRGRTLRSNGLARNNGRNCGFLCGPFR